MDPNDDKQHKPAFPHVPARRNPVHTRPAPTDEAVEPTDDQQKKKKKKKTKKGGARGVETMFRTSYRTHIDMSGLADSKANIMITINGLIVSILLGSISTRIETNPWLLLPTTVLLLCCLVSLVYAVLSARPRVSRRVITLGDVRENAANILFFGNFISMSEQDYVQGMHELLQDSDRLYTTMIRDIYSLGSVLERKFRMLRVSYTIFMFGLAIGVVLFILVYVSVVFVGVPGRAGAPI